MKGCNVQAATLAAGPRPPAEPHPAEAAGTAADAEMVDGGAAVAAADAEERRVGDMVVGEVEVMDLVPTIEEKPAVQSKA